MKTRLILSLLAGFFALASFTLVSSTQSNLPKITADEDSKVEMSSYNAAVKMTLESPAGGFVSDYELR